MDKIGNYQIIIRVAHFINCFQFVFEALNIFIRRIITVALIKPVKTLLPEIFKMAHGAVYFKIRQLCVAEFKIKITLPSDNSRVIHSLWHIGKKLAHFLLRFKIKFIRMEFKPCVLTEDMVCGNADKHLLHLGILFFDIMHIVCGNNRYTRFSTKAQNSVLNRFLLVYTVILNFKIIITVAENIAVPECRRLCPLIISGKQILRYFTRKAGGKANQSFVIFFKNIAIDSRFIIISFRVRKGNKVY